MAHATKPRVRLELRDGSGGSIMLRLGWLLNGYSPGAS